VKGWQALVLSVIAGALWVWLFATPAVPLP